MVNESEKLDSWREYFRSSNSDIFCIIEQAITVAALDFPTEMKLRRDRIVKSLFSCQFEDVRPTLAESVVNKESMVSIGKGDEVGFQTRNFSYGEAAALDDEMEKDHLTVKEVLRIKIILDHSKYETVQNILNSLMKLQLVDMSFGILKTTQVGKSVNAIRKHSNKEIQNMARMLLDSWREMVDELMSKTAALADATPQSYNSNVADDEEEGFGLPSPPMDDIAFLSSQTMELSNFFDGIDDYGNIGELQNNNANTRRKPPQSVPKHKEQIPIIQEKKKEVLIKKPASIVKQQKKSSPEPRKIAKVQKSAIAEGKIQKPQLGKIQKPQLDRKSVTMFDEDAKVEMTKKRLHNCYQEIDEAKKRRTIQVVEIHDLPKQVRKPLGRPKGAMGQKNSHLKSGIKSNNWQKIDRR